MVMKKRLDNGFNGFSDWTVPRGPRSLRVSKIASSDLSLYLSDLLNCYSNFVLHDSRRRFIERKISRMARSVQLNCWLL